MENLYRLLMQIVMGQPAEFGETRHELIVYGYTHIRIYPPFNTYT